MTSTPHIVERLKACPHCAATDAFTERADLSSSYVVCNNCLARGPVQCQDNDDEDEPGQASAIAAWNTRTPDPVITAYEAALKEADTAIESVMSDEYDAFYMKARHARDTIRAALSSKGTQP